MPCLLQAFQEGFEGTASDAYDGFSLWGRQTATSLSPCLLRRVLLRVLLRVVQRWFSGGTATAGTATICGAMHGTFIVGAATFVPGKLAAWSCGMILVKVAKRANRVESCGAVKKKDGRFTPEELGKVVVSYVAVLMLA